MVRNIKLAPIVLTLIISVALQLLFINKDRTDTPHRAVAEFVQLYFKLDPAMETRLCDQLKDADDGEAVDNYIYKLKKEAAERGLGLFYLHKKIYNVRTTAVSKGVESAQIRLEADVKPPLKAFFTGEKTRHIDEIINLVNDNGTWKICSPIFSIGNA